MPRRDYGSGSITPKGYIRCGYGEIQHRRVWKEHNGEVGKTAARYTRGRRPVSLVYSEVLKTRSEALKREADIKRLSKAEKENLIQSR